MRALIREIHATERGAASAKALKKTGPFSVGGTGRSLLRLEGQGSGRGSRI